MKTPEYKIGEIMIADFVNTAGNYEYPIEVIIQFTDETIYYGSSQLAAIPSDLVRYTSRSLTELGYKIIGIANKIDKYTQCIWVIEERVTCIDSLNTVIREIKHECGL